MVKKIVLVCFAILLVSGAFFQASYLSDISNAFLDMTREMENALAVGDLDLLYRHFSEMSERFERVRPTLASLLHHGDLDLLGIEITSLGGAINAGEVPDITVCINRVRYGVLQISGTESTQLENIL